MVFIQINFQFGSQLLCVPGNLESGGEYHHIKIFRHIDMFIIRGINNGQRFCFRIMKDTMRATSNQTNIVIVFCPI